MGFRRTTAIDDPRQFRYPSDMLRLTTKGWVLIILIFTGGALAALSYYAELSSLPLRETVAKLTRGRIRTERRQPSDAEIQAALLQALLKDATLRNLPLDIVVSEGAVTVTGVVPSMAERAAVEQLIRNVAGVKTMTLHLAVTHTGTSVRPPASEKEDPDLRLSKEVEFALYRTDAFDIRTMKVASREGVVRLSGTVRNLAEKLLAERIAREVEGVREVVNDLEVAR